MIGTPTALAGSAGTTSSYTLPSTVSPGSVLALCIIDGNGSSQTYSATDSKGNTYSSVPSYVENGVDVAWVIGAITTPLVGGTDTIVPKMNGSTAGILLVPVVCTGVTTTTDGSNHGTNTPSTAWSSGSITTTNANDLLLVAGAYNHGAAITETPGGSFTDITPTGAFFSGWPAGGFVAYQVVSSTGTYSASGSYSTSVNGNVAQILALEGAGGGPARTAPAGVQPGGQTRRVLLMIRKSFRPVMARQASAGRNGPRSWHVDVSRVPGPGPLSGRRAAARRDLGQQLPGPRRRCPPPPAVPMRGTSRLMGSASR